jgi:hypothetical protein
MQWQKKKGFALNATRAGGLLGLTADFNENFSLAMSYSMPDHKTNLPEHKALTISRENRKDGMVDLEMKWVSESSAVTQKMEISHPDFLVVRRLIEYAIPHIVGWSALEGRRVVEEDLEGGPSGPN